MLQKVAVGRWSLDAYDGLAPDAIMQELREHARALKGARILHVNATPYGGGVSELLRSSVPLLRDLGLTVDWKVIGGSQDFFHATKALHNALQGSPRSLSDAEQAVYLDCAQENAKTLDGGYDFIVIHDPQPAGLLSAHGKRDARWVWRCHIDTSEPNPAAWRFLEPYLEGFDAAVFTMAEFVPPDLPVDRVVTIAPAIDPLSPKIERVDGAEHDRDDRHVFEITDSGETEFQGWFEQEVGGLQLLRRPLLVKIALAGPERLEDALKQIDAYERDCADRLKELSRERDEIPDEGLQVRADHVLLRLGLSADISHLKAELGWARHARQMVSWLLNQDAIWPGRRRRTGSSPEEARDRQSAREELFGRIARRRLRPTRDESDQDHDG